MDSIRLMPRSLDLATFVAIDTPLPALQKDRNIASA
jgi:hypothetical protein